MSVTPPERARLSELVRTPYIGVLTYPKISLRTAKSRITQLEKLNVDVLVFEGKTRLGRLGILGLGTVSVVVKAEAESRVYALKIRRTDANRPSMDGEWKLTSYANRLGIGPALESHSRDFILMQALEYTELYDWFKGLRGPGSRSSAREMVHVVLNQCRKLDIMGLDHGQLSNLRKHAVVAGGRPWLIDFESASLARKPKNVTAAAQNLLIGGRMSSLVRRLIGAKETKPLLTLLGEYKEENSDIAYSRLLDFVGVAGKKH